MINDIKTESFTVNKKNIEVSLMSDRNLYDFLEPTVQIAFGTTMNGFYTGSCSRNSKSACPRNSVTPLRFCFECDSEMEGLRELSDVLN